MKIKSILLPTSINFITLFLFLFLFLLFALFPQIIFAQIVEGELQLKNKNQTHKLVFNKEKEPVIGKIILMDDVSITMRIDKEIFRFEQKDVAKIIVIDKAINPTNYTHLGLSQTGFNFKKREQKYNNFLVINNFYSRGIQDNFSVMGGVTFNPILNEGILEFHSRIKFTHSFNDNIHIGFAPSIHYFLGRFNELAFIPTVAVSLGKKNKFLNFSGARYFSKNSDLTIKNRDIFSIGGAIQIKENWTLMTDNIILIGDYEDIEDVILIPSLSVKLNKKHSSHEWHFGLYLWIDMEKGSCFDDCDVAINLSPVPLVAYSKYF